MSVPSYCDECGNSINVGDAAIMIHQQCDTRLTITLQEAKELQAYFLRAGYISYEFDMPIHDFYRKLSAFVIKHDMAD